MERAPKAKLEELDKKKYLVPSDLTGEIPSKLSWICKHSDHFLHTISSFEPLNQYCTDADGFINLLLLLG